MSEKVATHITQPRVYFSKNDKPLVGGKVYALKIGENEFKPTFRNAELTALNQNPIVLDQAGSCLIYMRGAVRLRVFDKNDVFIEERVIYQQRRIAQFFDKYGKALSFGKVQTFDYQSTIKKASYKNGDLNQNPVLLDENGCAEISIAGAYRLRSYNKSGVFIADQDFKRLPARVLTSRPYPIYFDESVQTSFDANNVVLNEATKMKIESINTSFSINSVSFRTPMNEVQTEPENINTNFVFNGAQITQKTTYNVADLQENVRTLINIESVQIVRFVNYIKNTMEIENLKTDFSLNSIQITN